MMSSTTTPPARKVSRVDEEGSEVVQEAGPSAQANPFLIDLVIDNLFGYCEFKDLAACRLVSKQWFKASLPNWLEKAPMLKLRLDPALSEHHSSRDKEYMSLFLRTAHNDDFRTYGPYEYAGLRQYKKFQVSGNAGIGAHYQLLQQFMRNVGHWVTDLKLKLTFPDLDIYRTVMLSRMSPNLVKLDASICFSANVDVAGGDYEIEQDVVHQKLTSLKICHRVKNDRDELPVVGWIQLLARYPNLKTLINGIPSAATPLDLDRMLEAAWTIRQADRKVLDLRNLKLRCVKSTFNLTSLLPLFRDTGLTLETFLISIGSLTPSQTITEVLDTQAATLNTLVIDKEAPLQNFQSLVMTSVRRLVIYGYPFENLTFLRGFTALECLTFGPGVKFDSMLRSTQKEHLKTLVIPTLKRLHWNYKPVAVFAWRTEYDFFSESIRKLRSIMPNLRDLQLWLVNESFREVCRCFPLLQRLCIFGYWVDDAGITGIVAGRSERNPDNIAKLQNLRSLTMEHFNEKYIHNVGPTAITEKSVAAILELPKLEKLDVAMDIKLVVDMKIIWTVREQMKSCEITWTAKRYNEEDEETSEDYKNDESNQTDDGDSDSD